MASARAAPEGAAERECALSLPDVEPPRASYVSPGGANCRVLEREPFFRDVSSQASAAVPSAADEEALDCELEQLAARRGVHGIDLEFR